MELIKGRLLLKALVLIVFVLSLVGCTQEPKAKQAQTKGSTSVVKKMPEKMTEVKMGLPSKRNMSYISIYVALKKGYYQKHNLDVKLTYVQGGVLALRGLQTGDFQIISSLPESVITGVAAGASTKIIGTFDNQSMYTIYVDKSIRDLKELKGKSAAGMVTGNGTNIQLEYWLRKHGLEPNKDVRIINAGDNAERLQAVQQGQAALTILSPPTDIRADEMGLKQYRMRDELTTYNHNMIVANGDLIKKQPEVLHAYMAANNEALKYVKDPANRDEVIKIIIEELEMTQSDAEKSFDFVLPALADQGRINLDGVDWAINTVKETGISKKEVSLEDLVDESFYPE
jgi:NitT/TauT family transport system substrate-binding protein